MVVLSLLCVLLEMHSLIVLCAKSCESLNSNFGQILLHLNRKFYFYSELFENDVIRSSSRSNFQCTQMQIRLRMEKSLYDFTYIIY